MLEKFLDIVFQNLSVEDVKLTDKFIDLGCDGFDYVEIVMKIEKEFNILIQDNYVIQSNGNDLEKIGDLYKVLFIHELPFSDMGLKYNEISDRVEEFEIFNSDYEVDLISLNSLFDFYGYEFSIDDYL